MKKLALLMALVLVNALIWMISCTGIAFFFSLAEEKGIRHASATLIGSSEDANTLKGTNGLPTGTAYTEVPHTVGDGVTDDSKAWTEFIDIVPDGSTIQLKPGKNYFLNSAGGIIFNKKIHLIGDGVKFTLGPSVGNAPGITVKSDGSVLEGFEIDCSSNHVDCTGNDDFKDDGDDLKHNLRGGIKVKGSNVVCNRIAITNTVVGIRYDSVNGGNITRCNIVNTKLDSTTGDSNNYNAGIFINGSKSVDVSMNRIMGHGQNILLGNTSKSCRIFANSVALAADNAIYVSSGNNCSIFENDIEGFKNNGIKVRGSYCNIHHNRIDVGLSGNKALVGIVVSGLLDIGDGFSGTACLVDSNIISGNLNIGIMTSVAYGMYPREVQIINNRIQFASASGGTSRYGIKIDHRTADSPLSDGMIIRGNTIRNHSWGIYVAAHPSRYHDHMDISQNILSGGIYNIELHNIRNSRVTGNTSRNATAEGTGISLTQSRHNLVSSNDCRDTKAVHTQRYGIQEKTGCDNNRFLYNETEGTTHKRYELVGPSSEVAVDRIYSATLSSDMTLDIGEAYIYFLDPAGAPRKIDPKPDVLWPQGYSITIVNRSKATQNLYFDSTRLNQAVTPGEKAAFMHIGDAWVKI